MELIRLAAVVAVAVAAISAGRGLVAAVLNAFFGLCLGCELYLPLRRPRLAR